MSYLQNCMATGCLLLHFILPKIATAAADEFLTTRDCERFLLGASGGDLAAEITARLRQLDGATFDLYLTPDGPAEKPELPIELAPGGTRLPSILELPPAPILLDGEEPPALWPEGRRRAETLPLPPLTAAALGLEAPPTLRANEADQVRATVEGDFLRLQTERPGNRPAGHVYLPLNSLALGFTHSLRHWQAARRKENPEGFARQTNPEKLENFFREEGVALLTLDRGRVRFGYRFGVYDLLREDPERLLVIDIVLVRPAARRALGPREFVFPSAKRGDGNSGLRNTSLGVELLGVDSFGEASPP